MHDLHRTDLGQEQKACVTETVTSLKSLMFFREKVQHDQHLQFLMFQSI